MAEVVVVDLLRHGEVDAEGWAFRGSTDVALSQKGWQQMRDVGDSLSSESFSKIGTSPLQRCFDFSKEMSSKKEIELETLENMREMDFGDWENRGFDELESEYGDLLHQFWQSPVGLCPPGGEAFEVFTQRVITGWQQWLADASGEHRLLVAHGGVIRVLLAHLLGMPMAHLWRLHLPYASWSRVSLLQGEQPRLLFMNREVSCKD
ncbi:MAG: alpha-ribazole phosphatase [Mariprofundaceae bacterium]